jgi:malate dehydrogenase (oxaloacetate-decarboxylating)
LNIHDIDRIEHDLKQFTDNGTNEDVDYIVVTDGEEVRYLLNNGRTD